MKKPEVPDTRVGIKLEFNPAFIHYCEELNKGVGDFFRAFVDACQRAANRPSHYERLRDRIKR